MVTRLHQATTRQDKLLKHKHDMRTEQSKPLVVYKASAGSGKTFTLATEYIKRLAANPYDYRSILAVTFTNKATEEMKARILSQLYGLWKGLDDSRPYADTICADLGISPAYLSKQAGLSLKLLMHNYSNFRIETIDSFFQSMLRNLARELDLPANLRIELNDAQIEELAVDELIENLNESDKLLGWIIKYINDNISEDKSWNVISSIKSFGQNIFKDFYKTSRDSLAEKLADGQFYNSYVARMTRMRDGFKAKMAGFASEFSKAIAEAGLEHGDFAYGKGGVSGFFIKIGNGIFDGSATSTRVTACKDNPEKWASKSSPNREAIVRLAEERLMSILNGALKCIEQEWEQYMSASLTVRHLNQLRLLNSIEEKVNELNAEANRFLLSDTQYLLMSLISESDTPFVYEKIGTSIKHIMIDEFQDTSTIQWRNFKVLLQECMSHDDSRNIIVGDVKQSIYRWRDSDWRLLNDITAQFPRPDRQLELCNLATNYRSQRNIVLFNNSFFTNAAEIESGQQESTAKGSALQLKTAYQDVAQKIPDRRKPAGLVGIDLLPADGYMERTMEITASHVRSLVGSGVAQSDIAILVRKNKHIPLIAKYLTENLPDISIVSDEAFRLDASIAVKTIVHAMHLLTNRDDKISALFLAKAYQNAIGGRRLTDEELVSMELEDALPREYAENMDKLAATPLYDLAERIYIMFGLNRLADQSAYVCAFFDQLSSFIDDFQPDIDAFVERWNDSICRTTIQTGEVEGVRLITIHKSKGLEFDSVIIPFCDWKLDKNNGDLLWCSPTKAPYNELPLVPVDFGKKLVGTVYEKDYAEECLQDAVDNLNLLYVAFTRAAGNLFVIGRRDVPKLRSELIRKCLPKVAGQLAQSELVEPDDKNEPITFRFGQLYAKEKKGKKASANVFTKPSAASGFEIKTYESKVSFRQSNKSQEFIGGEDGQQESSYIKTGSIMHQLLASISTPADIDKAVRQLELDGVLGGKELSPQRVASLLRKRLANPVAKEWFSGKWKLFRERSMLFTDDEGNVTERRPDRVMTDGSTVVVVDFKFGKPKEEHHLQVRQYAEVLKQMGYAKVEGYIWYVYNDKIEKA